MIQLPPDFKEFLKLFNAHGVEYLMIGGYAVNHYGHSRSTGDLDIWISRSPRNSKRAAAALREFGLADASEDLFLSEGQIIRIGVPPVRIEIHTSASGVEFEECATGRETLLVEGLPVPVVSLQDLKRNKRAAGRMKDLADLEALE